MCSLYYTRSSKLYPPVSSTIVTYSMAATIYFINYTLRLLWHKHRLLRVMHRRVCRRTTEKTRIAIVAVCYVT